MTRKKDLPRLSGKQKRMFEAARLRFQENKSNPQIADILGLATGTVEQYFASDEMNEFTRFYSDQELFRLQGSLEEGVRDSKNRAIDLLQRAYMSEDATEQDLIRAAKQLQKVQERHLKLLQELGAVPRRQEGMDVDEGEGAENVEINLDFIEDGEIELEGEDPELVQQVQVEEEAKQRENNGE